jgi:hypothetical protein
MWSLTSPRTKRISGPKNFCCSAKKDFFNTIRQKQSFELWLSSYWGLGVFAKTPADISRRMKLNLAIEEHFTLGAASLRVIISAIAADNI